jgi:hypothetical protein
MPVRRFVVLMLGLLVLAVNFAAQAQPTPSSNWMHEVDFAEWTGGWFGDGYTLGVGFVMNRLDTGWYGGAINRWVTVPFPWDTVFTRIEVDVIYDGPPDGAYGANIWPGSPGWQPVTSNPFTAVSTGAISWYHVTCGCGEIGFQGWISRYVYGTVTVKRIRIYGYNTNPFAGEVPPTQTPTASTTPTPTRTPTITGTRSVTPTRTRTPTRTPTATRTPTITGTRSITPSRTPTRTATATRTPSPTRTPSNTRTPSRTPSPTLPVCQPSASALSDVSAQATEVCVAPSNTRRPTRTPSATRTFTPSPTFTPTLPPAYKVRFSNELGAGTAWTPDELAVIQTAIGNVGEAFRIQMGLSSPIEAYNRVLVNGDNPDYVYFYRANGISETVTIQYLPGAPQASLTVTVTIGGCQTFNSLPRVIVCNWSPTQFAAFPEQAIVHELGHVFTNRSQYAAGEGDEVIRGLLYAAVQNTYSGVCSPAFSGVNFGNTSGCNRIVDRSPGLVMGLDVDLAWQRGERGWGSGPDNTFTAFQQHPLEVFPDDLPDVQVDETAADMFLNWVYRKVTDPSGTLYAIVPGTWQGFLNISWRNNSTGSNDPSFPGDARYEWMNNVVSRIFVLKGW